MTQIRTMTEQDVPAVSRLLGGSWRHTYSPILGAETTARLSDDKHAPERLTEELGDDSKMSFVAERPDGSLAGYAMAAMDDKGEVMLERLHIDKSEYGTGLAADLLHAVLAAHAGIPSIALEVTEGNDRAIAFYRKHGFEVVERRPAAHGVGGHASLIMRRLLPMA
ncbi:GNAT family N-acetyltransferase [Mesorhizobium sp. M1088]|uniref:GNAT family N-acetyltransferase n=1 Tax=Mesorhizobium sp. M1088 TaxID=2957056 RepID=UPI003338EA6B